MDRQQEQLLAYSSAQTLDQYRNDSTDGNIQYNTKDRNSARDVIMFRNANRCSCNSRADTGNQLTEQDDM